MLALSSPTIRFNQISLLGCTGKPSTSTWTKFDQILTLNPPGVDKNSNCTYYQSTVCHVTPWTFYNPPLVHVVIECPLYMTLKPRIHVYLQFLILAILRSSVFLSQPFGHIFYLFIFFCFISMKISQRFLDIKDGTKFL